MRAVADEMFSDGTCNWGRLVALLAFAGRLGCIVRSRQARDGAGDHLITAYLAQHQFLDEGWMKVQSKYKVEGWHWLTASERRTPLKPIVLPVLPCLLN
jgi:hypothetical protein